MPRQGLVLHKNLGSQVQAPKAGLIVLFGLLGDKLATAASTWMFLFVVTHGAESLKTEGEIFSWLHTAKKVLNLPWFLDAHVHSPPHPDLGYLQDMQDSEQ